MYEYVKIEIFTTKGIELFLLNNWVITFSTQIINSYKLFFFFLLESGKCNNEVSFRVSSEYEF